MPPSVAHDLSLEREPSMPCQPQAEEEPRRLSKLRSPWPNDQPSAVAPSGGSGRRSRNEATGMGLEAGSHTPVTVELSSQSRLAAS